ncbi:MAG: precorrin-3B C(17)-methyltransferase [Pseudomonadota bacterium]
MTSSSFKLKDVAIVLLNPRASEIAAELKARLNAAQSGTEVFGLTQRVPQADTHFSKTAETLQSLFSQNRPIVAFCAAGILIRALAPALGQKREEPPVIAISDDVAHVVPLLGGLSGAHELAQEIAEILSATPVITASGARAFGLQFETPPIGYTLANPENATRITSDILGGASVVVEGSAQFLENASLPKSVSQDAEETRTISIGTAPRSADSDLHYIAHQIVAVPQSPNADADDLAHLAEQHALAPTSIATILAPEGRDPATSWRDAPDVSLRYGAHSSDWATLATAHDWHLFDAKTPAIAATAGRPHGELAVVGLGPGVPNAMTRDAAATLQAAEDIVGYETYVALVPDIRADQHVHVSGNRVEIVRAEAALDLAAQGRRVALVTSGDPGIFAMASAVMEPFEAHPGRWCGFDLRIIPGTSAMQTAAARIGAPIGHDFCAISLSDIRKPWPVVAKRLRKAAEGDFVIALYNPASKTRRQQIHDAHALLLEHRKPETCVVLGRNLGRPGERTEVTTLGALTPDTIDMRTVVIIGSSRTRSFTGPMGRTWVYTPRTYELDEDNADVGHG